MLANVNGMKVFLSSEEQGRIRSKAETDLIERLDSVKSYVEAMRDERADHGKTGHGTQVGFDNNVNSLLEALDSYYQIFQGYVKPDVLCRGFERDEKGHRL
jgi:hypothetical protein